MSLKSDVFEKVVIFGIYLRMTDRMGAEKRSYVMSRIRNKNAGLEPAVRKGIGRKTWPSFFRKKES